MSVKVSVAEDSSSKPVIRSPPDEVETRWRESRQGPRFGEARTGAGKTTSGAKFLHLALQMIRARSRALKSLSGQLAG